MIFWSWPKQPMKFAITGSNGHVVDAGKSALHQTICVEFPILVAIGAEPLGFVIVPLIGKTNGDTIISEGPDFFGQAIVLFTLPLACDV